MFLGCVQPLLCHLRPCASLIELDPANREMYITDMEIRK
jgi:hypothetical protein